MELRAHEDRAHQVAPRRFKSENQLILVFDRAAGGDDDLITVWIEEKLQMKSGKRMIRKPTLLAVRDIGWLFLQVSGLPFDTRKLINLTTL